jgi:hypothetical protein
VAEDLARAADQLHRADLDRLGVDADDDQPAARAEAVDDRGHRLGVDDRRQDDLRAAELLQLLRHVLGGRVDVDVRAELLGQRLLVLAAGDRHGLEPHLGRVLHAEVAEAADAEDRHDVARPRVGLAQRVVGGDARAQQRRGVDGVEVVRDPRQRVERDHDLLGPAAVVGDARDLEVLALDEVAAAARVAAEARAAEPADADAVAGPDVLHALADGVHDARDLVPRHARVLDRHVPQRGDRVAVADAAGLDGHAHLAAPGLLHLPLDQLEVCARRGHLHCSVCRHASRL